MLNHMKQTTLIPHMSSTELFRRYRNCKNVQEARRWHILWLISSNMPVNTVAATTGMSRTWIWHICTRYNALGPAGVRRQQTRKAGAQSLLSATQFRQLQHAVTQPAHDSGRWTSQKVAAWIAQATNRPHVATRTGWVYLCKCRQGTNTTLISQ
jgi:predicted DNA-binding transcriptional regulator AlpA